MPESKEDPHEVVRPEVPTFKVRDVFTQAQACGCPSGSHEPGCEAEVRRRVAAGAGGGEER